MAFTESTEQNLRELAALVARSHDLMASIDALKVQILRTGERGSVSAVADACGVTQQFISKWAKANVPPASAPEEFERRTLAADLRGMQEDGGEVARIVGLERAAQVIESGAGTVTRAQAAEEIRVAVRSGNGASVSAHMEFGAAALERTPAPASTGQPLPTANGIRAAAAKAGEQQEHQEVKPAPANVRHVSQVLKAAGHRPRHGQKRDGAGGFQAKQEHDGRVYVSHRFGPEADDMEPGEIADLRSVLHDEYASALKRAGYPLDDRLPGAPVYTWGIGTAKPKGTTYTAPDGTTRTSAHAYTHAVVAVGDDDRCRVPTAVSFHAGEHLADRKAASLKNFTTLVVPVTRDGSIAPEWTARVQAMQPQA